MNSPHSHSYSDNGCLSRVNCMTEHIRRAENLLYSESRGVAAEPCWLRWRRSSSPRSLGRLSSRMKAARRGMRLFRKASLRMHRSLAARSLSSPLSTPDLDAWSPQRLGEWMVEAWSNADCEVEGERADTIWRSGTGPAVRLGHCLASAPCARVATRGDVDDSRHRGARKKGGQGTFSVVRRERLND